MEEPSTLNEQSLQNHTNAQHLKELWDAVNSLSEIHREAVILHYFDGYTYEEISESLDIPVSTVQGRLQVARRRLRTEFSSAVAALNLSRLQAPDGLVQKVMDAIRHLSPIPKGNVGRFIPSLLIVSVLTITMALFYVVRYRSEENQQQAENQSQNANLVFFDDFDDGDVSDWERGYYKGELDLDGKLDGTPTALASSGAAASGSYGKIVTLRETSESSGIFSGSLKTEYGRITQAQTSEVYTQRLGLLGGEIVTATYTDALIETGETNVEVIDTCRANMVGKATYTTEKVIIDGIPDKWPLENVMRTEQGEALMWAQWDTYNLYLFVQIRDTEVIVPDPTKWYSGADALELHFDLQPTKYIRPSYLSNSPKPQNYIFWLCPKGGDIDGSAKYAGQAHPRQIYNYSPPIEMAFRPFASLEGRTYADYYTMEIAIPFGVVLGGFDPLKTRRNELIGFNYIIHRSDAPPVQWARPAPLGKGSGTERQIPPSELGILILQRGK